jgi:hypothetical protein
VTVRYVLRLVGEPTLTLPYQQRRELLAGLGLFNDVVRVPPHFVDIDGRQVLAAAEADGLEGVVAKRLTSTYQPGRRSPDWIKTPSVRETIRSAAENRRSERVGPQLVMRHTCRGRRLAITPHRFGGSRQPHL